MLTHKPEWEYPHKHQKIYIKDGHLGGTCAEGDANSWFPEMWSWLIDSFGLRSMLDVGCGCGYAMKFFWEQGVDVIGFDGSEKVLAHHVCHVLKKQHPNAGIQVLQHDLTHGPWVNPTGPSDIVWCCEVAEHIEERFVPNVIQTLRDNTNKILALCAAPKGAGGYHHVNCQDPPYWVGKLETDKFVYDPITTDHCRQMCDANYGRTARNYFRRSGLIFRRV